MSDVWDEKMISQVMSMGTEKKKKLLIDSIRASYIIFWCQSSNMGTDVEINQHMNDFCSECFAVAADMNEQFLNDTKGIKEKFINPYKRQKNKLV